MNKLNNLKRKLEYTKEKHKKDKVITFDTNIYFMCNDILNTLDEIVEEVRAEVIDGLIKDYCITDYLGNETVVIEKKRLEQLKEQK